MPLQSPQTGLLTCGDAQIFCETFGRGRPLLFIHGFPLNGQMWHAAALRLADRWRCIVPDLRGMGRSPATPSASIAEHAQDLAAVLDRLGQVGPVVVVGLSMGGIVAFEFFRRYRARVAGLVLTCTRANAESAEGIARREALAESVLQRGSPAAADVMIDAAFAPGAPMPLRVYWYQAMCGCAPLGVAAASRALATRADSYPTLATINVPTLVVAGDSDSITPPDTLREIQRGIAGASLVTIAGAGHLPPLERPDEYAAALRAFLSGFWE